MYERIAKTFSLLLLGSGQEVVFQLLGAAIWIQSWGVEVYGEWVMLSLIPMLATRGSSGLFHVAASQMIAAVAGNQRDAAAHTLRVLRRAQTFWLAGIALVLVVISTTLFASNPNPQISFLSVAAITAVFVIQFGLFQWQQADLTMLKAEGQAPRAVLWQTAFRTAFVIAILVCSIWFGPALSLTVAVVAQALVWLLTHIRLGSLRAQYDVHVDSTARVSMPALIRQGLQFSAFPLGQIGLHSIAVWAVGLAASPVAGAAFHNMRTISRMLVLVARAVEQALRLEMSAVIIRDGIDLAKTLCRRAFNITLIIGIVWTAALLWIGPWVFRWITRGELAFDLVVFTLLCLAALCFSLAQPFSAALFAINRHGPLANRYVLLLIAAAVTIVIVAFRGITSVAIGMLAADFALLILAQHALSEVRHNTVGGMTHVV
ncbi:MAG: hypothetical protein AAFN07_06920 [Pseudomonadota bacterium]